MKIYHISLKTLHFAVKSGVLCPQYCNIDVNIAIFMRKLLRVATTSISTNLLISIFSRQIFADKNAVKQYLFAWRYFYQRKSAWKILKLTNLLKLI